jgi:hypothetical protein
MDRAEELKKSPPMTTEIYVCAMQQFGFWES